jgi:hypothetical protein
MVSTARRALVLVLVLSLALTACGRSGTRVTADDGRGIDRPGGGIWIPETRGVDVEEHDALEADDEDEEEDEDGVTDDAAEPGDGEPAGDATATAPVEDEPHQPRVPEPPSPRRSADDAGTPAPTADSSGGGDGLREDGGTGSSSDQDAAEEGEEDDEPAEPEVVGDCGVAQTEEPPARDELEEEVARLRVLVAERWPATQAGAWILADEDRPTVHVGFTRSVRSSLRAVCEEFAYPQLLHGVRTELSEAELEEHLEVVLAERDALREGEPPADLPREIRATLGRYVAHVGHAANGLLVTVEEPTERLRDVFRDRYLERLQLAEGSFDEDGELVVDED